MAISVVQSVKGGQAAGSTTATATGVAVGSGNAITGFVAWHTATTTDLSSITDNASGNTYTILNRQSATSLADNWCGATFACTNVINGPTILTATFGSSITDIEIVWSESTGYSGTVAVDGHASNVQGGPGTTADAITSGSITTADNGDFIFGAVLDITGGSGVTTAGTGFTLLINNDASNATNFTSTEWKVQSSAGPVAGTFTDTAHGAGEHYITGVIALGVSGGGGGDTLMGAICL